MEYRNKSRESRLVKKLFSKEKDNKIGIFDG